MTDWSLLTNHAKLLLAIEREPGLRVREMAERLGLSERGIALILRDLRTSGCVTSRREGRRSLYTVVPDKRLGGDDLQHRTVGEFLRRLA